MWNSLKQGGFGILRNAEIKFWLLDKNSKPLHQKPMAKMVVMKSDKYEVSHQKMSKVEKQKDILRAIKSSKSKYLPLFYYTCQKD